MKENMDNNLTFFKFVKIDDDFEIDFIIANNLDQAKEIMEDYFNLQPGEASEMFNSRNLTQEEIDKSNLLDQFVYYEDLDEIPPEHIGKVEDGYLIIKTFREVLNDSKQKAGWFCDSGYRM